MSIAKIWISFLRFRRATVGLSNRGAGALTWLAMVRRVLEALLHPTTAAAVLLGALAAAGIESALFAASLTQHHLYAWIWLVVIAAPAATLGLASSLLTLAGDE